nr:hypothetical protein GCM10017745_42530 [Saccharothrix mutabilis subsp. capreolus]
MVVGAVGWLGAGDGSAALRAVRPPLPRTDRRDRAGGPLGGRRGGGGDEPWTGDPRPAQPPHDSRAAADTPRGEESSRDRAGGVPEPRDPAGGAGSVAAGPDRGRRAAGVWTAGPGGVRPSRAIRVGERAASPRGPAAAGGTRASWGAGPPQGPAAAGVGREPHRVRSSGTGAGARPARS